MPLTNCQPWMESFFCYNVCTISNFCTYKWMRFLMSASTLTIRMDDELKRSAADVAEYYGLDLSSVVRSVFKQMVNTGRIPLTFAPEEPNGESLNAAAEADSFMASGKTGRFTNGHDLLEAAMR